MFDFSPANRICARTGRELRTGDRIQSVLFERDGKLVREDIALEEWNGPPEGAYAWWQARVPAPDAIKPVVMDDGLALDTFIRLENTGLEDQLRIRYVLALWLVRRRKLRLIETERIEGTDWLLCKEPRGKTVYRVADPRMDETAVTQAQIELERMLQAA